MGFYVKCEDCGREYRGWGNSEKCEVCGGKLIDIKKVNESGRVKRFLRVLKEIFRPKPPYEIKW